MEIARNLWRRKLRTVLTVTGIVMGIFALTTMGAMAEHFDALINGGITYYGSNIQVCGRQRVDHLRVRRATCPSPRSPRSSGSPAWPRRHPQLDEIAKPGSVTW